jgi:VanZ family protein
VLKQVFFLAAIFWTGIIAFFCLVQLNNVPFTSVSNLDKLVHTFFYFVFTSLWFLFFKKHLSNSNGLKPLVISFLLSFVFGISIEILQELFTATRHADLFDVLANLFGATLAAVVVIIFLNMYKNFVSDNRDKF